MYQVDSRLRKNGLKKNQLAPKILSYPITTVGLCLTTILLLLFIIIAATQMHLVSKWRQPRSVHKIKPGDRGRVSLPFE